MLYQQLRSTGSTAIRASKIRYCGKHFPNATSSLSGPASRIFRRSSAQTTFFSFLRKPTHVCESAVTRRSARPTCPSLTAELLVMNHDGCPPLVMSGEGEVEGSVQPGGLARLEDVRHSRKKSSDGIRPQAVAHVFDLFVWKPFADIHLGVANLDKSHVVVKRGSFSKLNSIPLLDAFIDFYSPGSWEAARILPAPSWSSQFRSGNSSRR